MSRVTKWDYVPDAMRDELEFILERRTKPTPEVELAAAVMVQAIVDIKRGFDGTFGESFANDARRWVASTDEDAGGITFEMACMMLRLDVDAARQRVLAMQQAPRHLNNMVLESTLRRRPITRHQMSQTQRVKAHKRWDGVPA